MDLLCIRCKGKGLCGKPCKILSKFKDSAPKVKTHFSGSSPPEIFVGRIGYPYVNSGILSPVSHEDSSSFSSPEDWIRDDLSIDNILSKRGKLVYGRGKSRIKSDWKNPLNKVTQELALASKPVSTEVFLKKKPSFNFSASKFFQIITNPAPIKRAILEENVPVEKKVDYLVSDYDVKSTTALQELYSSKKITTSHMQKLLSAGLLGTKNKRKMVPTRWSITAVDDTLGKQILEDVRYLPELQEIRLFHHYYNGNHFEALLLPSSWAFEVIEVSMQGSNWNETIKASGDVFMQDYEGFYPRKKYAENVVGAYYADRLAVAEYLKKIRKQACVLLFHEEREEYYAPLGVGIIRESLRKMFSGDYEVPVDLNDALLRIGMRVKADMWRYKKMSWILNNLAKQKKLKDFF